jgi:DNA-binding transcriptional MerR regulator
VVGAEGLLRIGELSRRTGVSVDVIRAWERRYGLLRPGRTDGGFRVYSVDDIARLRLMRHYLAEGIPTAQAAALVHRVQTAALDANPGVPPGDVRKALRLLRDSLESFNDAPADRMLERLLGVFSPAAVLRDVVLPYLRELGKRWECGVATVAQCWRASPATVTHSDCSRSASPCGTSGGGSPTSAPTPRSPLSTVPPTPCAATSWCSRQRCRPGSPRSPATCAHCRARTRSRSAARV